MNISKILNPKILIILVIILAGTSVYLFNQVSITKQNPNAVSEAEAKSLVKKVGMHIVLPKDEIPTIATVSDPEALKDQTFFANAKKGDKVLIYTNAKMAVLYDVIIDKIITVAPLTIGDSPKDSVTREELQGGEETK